MSETVKDKWELALDEKLAELEAHKKEKGFTSSTQCPDFPNCPICDAYVKAVYESMSKGKGGGFEF